MENKNKLLYFGSLLIIFLAFALMSYVFFLTFLHGSEPTTFNNLPFPTNKELYYPGDRIFVEASFCKNLDVTATVTSNLVDGFLSTAPPQKISGSLGCQNVTVFTMKVPEHIGSGDYYLDGVIVYDVNKLRSIPIRVSSQWFIIADEKEE